jgi:hypothetical protein
MRVGPSRGFVRFVAISEECSGWRGNTIAGAWERERDKDKGAERDGVSERKDEEESPVLRRRAMRVCSKPACNRPRIPLTTDSLSPSSDRKLATAGLRTPTKPRDRSPTPLRVFKMVEKQLSAKATVGDCARRRVSCTRYLAKPIAVRHDGAERERVTPCRNYDRPTRLSSNKRPRLSRQLHGAGCRCNSIAVTTVSEYLNEYGMGQNE